MTILIIIITFIAALLATVIYCNFLLKRKREEEDFLKAIGLSPQLRREIRTGTEGELRKRIEEDIKCLLNSKLKKVEELEEDIKNSAKISDLSMDKLLEKYSDTQRKIEVAQREKEKATKVAKRLGFEV